MMLHNNNNLDSSGICLNLILLNNYPVVGKSPNLLEIGIGYGIMATRRQFAGSFPYLSRSAAFYRKVRSAERIARDIPQDEQ